MIRVFLSYAREDLQRVETLYQNLLAAGFQPWMDTHNLTAGENWPEEIERGMQSADCFVACISNHSITKGGVLAEELRTAVERWSKTRGDYRLIPVRLESVEPPPSIAHLHRYDLFRDDQWTGLAEAIRKKTQPRRWIKVAAISVGIICLAAAVWYLSRDTGVPWPPGPVRVGVTLWRLREPKPEDLPGAKMLVHAEPGAPKAREYVPERWPLEKPFGLGSLIRASFSSAQPGFLYVIDQEQHSGGAEGRPKLIFPTRKLRGGHNEVAKGILVETPAHEDIPPYWELQDLSPDHTGEILTVILAKQPIAELIAGEEASDVDPSWLQARLKEWQTPVTKVQSGAGIAATPAEIEAGKDRRQGAH